MRTEVEGLDLDALETVARGATQGTWYRSGGRNDLYDGKRPVNGHGICVEGSQITIAHVFYDKQTGEGFNDAAHIATFDPPTVRRILSALRAQAERVRVLETAVLDASISDRLDEAGSPLSWREVAEAAERKVEILKQQIASLEDRNEDYRECYVTQRDQAAESEARAEAAERRAGELEGALSALIVHFEGDELHDEGAFDIECPDCVALEAARAILPATKAEGEK